MGEIFEFDSIKQYFSAETWDGLSTLEKIHYRNLKRNYDFLKSSGINLNAPKFMEPKKKAFKPYVFTKSTFKEEYERIQHEFELYDGTLDSRSGSRSNIKVEGARSNIKIEGIPDLADSSSSCRFCMSPKNTPYQYGMKRLDRTNSVKSNDIVSNTLHRMRKLVYKPRTFVKEEPSNQYFHPGKPKSFFARAKKLYVAQTVCHDVIRDFMSIEVVENHRRR